MFSKTRKALTLSILKRFKDLCDKVVEELGLEARFIKIRVDRSLDEGRQTVRLSRIRIVSNLSIEKARD